MHCATSWPLRILSEGRAKRSFEIFLKGFKITNSKLRFTQYSCQGFILGTGHTTACMLVKSANTMERKATQAALRAAEMFQIKSELGSLDRSFFRVDS
jgi:hypothetical protein